MGNFINKIIPANKFTSDVTWSLLSFATLSACGILLNVIVTNRYGSEGTGIFNQALALYLIAGSLAVFGLNTSVIKYSAAASDQPSELSKSLGSSLLLVLIFSSILTAILYAAGIFFPYLLVNREVAAALVVLTAGIPFFSMGKVLSGHLNGLRKMKIYAVVQTARWVFILVFIVVSVLTERSLAFCMLSFVLAEIAAFIWLLTVALKTTEYRLRYSHEWLKKHFSFGGKSLMAGILSDTSDKLDVIFIGVIMNNQAAGIYGFAASVARGIPALASVVQLNFSPVASALWEKNDIASLKYRMGQVFFYNLLVFIPVTIVAIIAYPVFVHYFVVDNLIASGNLLFTVLCAGMGFASVFYFLGAFLSMCGMPRQQLYLTASLFVYNASALWVFTSLWALPGAAFATSTSFVFLVFLLFFFIRKNTGINIFSVLAAARHRQLNKTV